MLAGRNLRRRIDDAIATASPLALAEAMDAHICRRSSSELRGIIERSRKRMDASERSQVDLYLNLNDANDLLGHRFSAFLRQNPRAIACLDPDVVDGILGELGDLPPVEHFRRRLSGRTSVLLAAVLAIAILPLAAQYAHQRGLLAGLNDPLLQPASFAPFVERIAQPQRARARIARIAHRKPVRVHRVAVRPHYAPTPTHHVIAPRPHQPHHVYVARAQWHRPISADSSRFGMRARSSVRAYLGALIAGNLPAAMRHLGLPADGDTGAISELPIVTRHTNVAIVGSSPQPDGREKVQADILTGGREYFEVFYVERDGPAARIADRYYIPVNRRAQLVSLTRIR